MKEIPLTQGYVAIVDDNLSGEFLNHKWSASVSIRSDGSKSVYAKRHPGGKAIYLHRLIMNAKNGEHVDHVNGNGLDCRKENMRICTNTENQYNKRPQSGGTSKYKGVYWEKSRSKWHASIMLNKKRFPLGRFTSEIDAARAYDAAALKYFGEFARINTYEAQDE
jgi:hypothetical protein